MARKQKEKKVKEPKPKKVKEKKPKPDKKAIRAQKKELKEKTNPGGGFLLGILIFFLIVVGIFDICVLAYIVVTLFTSLPI